jgi:hypothetical protein
MEGQRREAEFGLETGERPTFARLTINAVCCDRPLSIRTDVIELPDGRLALDAETLRLAVHVHVSRCGGR